MQVVARVHRDKLNIIKVNDAQIILFKCRGNIDGKIQEKEAIVN